MTTVDGGGCGVRVNRRLLWAINREPRTILRVQNRLDSLGNFLIAGTAADVGLQPFMHGFITGFGMIVDQSLAVHDKT